MNFCVREREIFWQSLGCNVLNVHHYYQGCLHRYTSTYFHIFYPFIWLPSRIIKLLPLTCFWLTSMRILIYYFNCPCYNDVSQKLFFVSFGFLWNWLQAVACIPLYCYTCPPAPYPKYIERGVCNVICCLKTIAYSFVGYPDLIFMIRCCS